VLDEPFARAGPGPAGGSGRRERIVRQPFGFQTLGARKCGDPGKSGAKSGISFLDTDDDGFWRTSSHTVAAIQDVLGGAAWVGDSGRAGPRRGGALSKEDPNVTITIDLAEKGR